MTSLSQCAKADISGSWPRIPEGGPLQCCLEGRLGSLQLWGWSVFSLAPTYCSSQPRTFCSNLLLSETMAANVPSASPTDCCPLAVLFWTFVVTYDVSLEVSLFRSRYPDQHAIHTPAANKSELGQMNNPWSHTFHQESCFQSFKTARKIRSAEAQDQ
ncbi:hypothetical protein F5141DRAFT_1205034 [Pisolithus sp. B1]|nr:hypothetical protein F5141DRAFT_1205034 [Pisolithus sp. B1]